MGAVAEPAELPSPAQAEQRARALRAAKREPAPLGKASDDLAQALEDYVRATRARDRNALRNAEASVYGANRQLDEVTESLARSCGLRPRRTFAEIRSAVAQIGGAVCWCFENAGTGVGGRVTMSFDVDGSGSVSRPDWITDRELGWTAAELQFVARSAKASVLLPSTAARHWVVDCVREAWSELDLTPGYRSAHVAALTVNLGRTDPADIGLLCGPSRDLPTPMLDPDRERGRGYEPSGPSY